MRTGSRKGENLGVAFERIRSGWRVHNSRTLGIGQVVFQQPLERGVNKNV